MSENTPPVPVSPLEHGLRGMCSWLTTVADGVQRNKPANPSGYADGYYDGMEQAYRWMLEALDTLLRQHAEASPDRWSPPDIFID